CSMTIETSVGGAAERAEIFPICAGWRCKGSPDIPGTTGFRRWPGSNFLDLDERPCLPRGTQGFLLFGGMQFHAVRGDVRARSRKRVGIILLQKLDEALANETAKVKCGGGIVGAHDGAELHGALSEIGDLQSGCAAIPEFGVFDDAKELFA